MKYSLTLLLLFLISAVLVACGGQATILDTPAASVEAVVQETTDAAGFSGLPAIPDDLDDSARSSSEAGDIGSSVVLGSEYLLMDGGYVEDTSLVLAPEPAGEGESTTPGFGLYKASGLAGKRPLSLNIECVPGGLDEPYFIGVADYTARHWRWFGPVNFPEFELDLREVNNQLTTHLGNMYFLIAVAPGNTATHAQSTVIWGEPGPGAMPGSPHHLVASDGQFAEAVKLNWVGANGAAQYEVFRKPVIHGAEWDRIGETEQTQFLDQPLPDYRMFCYRVRAIGPNGPSGFSNVDTGFAGGGNDPGVIKGDVTTINGEPLAGIRIGIVGLGDEMSRMTNEEGKFHFGDLAPGVYIVAAFKPGMEFFPAYHVVDLRDSVLADVHFNAAPSSVFRRVYGFVVSPAPPDAEPGIIPVPDIEVRANLAGQPEDFVSTTTDEHGFYVLNGLSDGVNILRAVSEEFMFVPQFHEVVVNGTNPPDRRDFLALPNDGGEGPPPPGDPPPGDPPPGE